MYIHTSCNTLTETLMGYIEDAKELITESKETFKEIKEAYEESLHDRTVKPKLLIKIKNFMENLRSALEFTAHDLFDKYGSSTASDPYIYFPYAWSGLSLADFQTKNIIERFIPGLNASRPDIAGKLEDYQWFANTNNEWLPKFMDLNNENKHQRLTPQTRKETKELRIQTGNVGMRLSGGASIKISGNATIRMGNSIIRGNQRISPNNPARIEGDAKQEVITWVSFHFTDNNEPVIPLLEAALNGVEKIINELDGI